MKLGLSTYTYTWAIGIPGQPPARPLTALDLLRRAATLGVQVVQMADNLPLAGLSPAELDAFQSEAENLGIQVEVGTGGIAPDHIRRYLDLAKRFRSPVLRVVIDTAGHHPSPAEVVETLSPLRPEFEAAGTMLAIENHDRFQASVFADMVRRLGTNWAGICLDTVNSFGALEGPQVVLAELGSLVVNLHVKDFTIFRPAHRMGFSVEGRPAGKGMLNVPGLLEQLGGSRRSFNAILELWTPPEASLAATICKEQRWAEESITFLRTFIPE